MPRLILKQKDRILLLDFNRIRKISNKFKHFRESSNSKYLVVLRQQSSLLNLGTSP